MTLTKQAECQKEEKPQEEEVQSEPNPTPQQSLTKQEQFGEVWKERERKHAFGQRSLGRGGGGPVEGRRVEGQLEEGLPGQALSPYLLVDAPLAGTVG